MNTEVCIPDIGDYRDVPVIEVLVREGDSVAAGDTLLTLESDKAVIEVPAPVSGVVRSVALKVGDRVSAGVPILTITHGEPSGRHNDIGGGSRPPEHADRHSAIAPEVRLPEAAVPIDVRPPSSPAAAGPPARELQRDSGLSYSGPAVRRLARELGVDLAAVRGSGRHGRVVKADVIAHVRQIVATGPAEASPGALPKPPVRRIDFAKYGPIEQEPLSRVRRVSAGNLASNWAAIPHVTNHHEADVTELDAFRRQVNTEAESGGAKVTLLAFVLKACAAALRAHPGFNVSLDGDTLVLKKYVHIGFAVDTPAGLVVPVIRDADRKGALQIAAESAELAGRAREGRLAAEEMKGGCFTVSSLGANGGGHFTPIINAPEVAVLGVSAAALRPVWNGGQFLPRLMLPLSLSWDHRALDGAAAARFNHFLVTVLGDFRRLVL